MFMKIKARIAGLIFIILVTTANTIVSQQDHKYLALVTNLTGIVEVKRVQKLEFEKAVWGMQLFQGDKIKTLESSEVSLLFSNSNLVALGPNNMLTISEGTVSSNKSPKPIKNMNPELFTDLSSLTLRRTSEGEIGALAGLRFSGREQAIELHSPRNSKIKNNQPSFVWHSSKEFDKFNVKLYDSNGLVWTRKVATAKLDYPEDEKPLEYGKSYFWQVEGEGLFETIKSYSIGFSIITQDERQKVQSQEQKVIELFEDEPNSSNFHFILGAYYDKKGLFEDAISKFEVIAKMNPNAPLPHEILGKLYSNIELKDQAIAELQKALKLSKK